MMEINRGHDLPSLGKASESQSDMKTCFCSILFPIFKENVLLSQSDTTTYWYPTYPPKPSNKKHPKPTKVTPVLPISSGENPMQCYNVLLSLSWLADLSDAVFLYENDALITEAMNGESDKDTPGPSLTTMNGIIVPLVKKGELC